MQCFLVPTTHWDREWYRTFQAFRARLVDTVDRVLDLMAGDDGYVFLLDGQAVVLEDYLAVRPQRRGELEQAARAGRLGLGPWYVQPDSLLPSGEAHVRNLLEGRRVASAVGPVSRVAYTPDSFGHPAAFPQLLAGFGLQAFVYWRGNGEEIDHLGPAYVWVGPDGSEVVACHLRDGYCNAASLPADPHEAAERLRTAARRAAGGAGWVLLMNGCDHLPPDPNTREAAEALAAATGWSVRRALLDEAVAGLDPRSLPRFSGELVGGRVANLLPGVWSARVPLKLRNRRCEALLEGWAEPWSALAHRLGDTSCEHAARTVPRLQDERPSLRAAWRALLQNQAHDSICGCSQDAVHRQMQARYDESEELATETTRRCLERLAGLGTERRVPWSDEITLAVFNPSPHPRTDLVRFPLDAHPPFTPQGAHPLIGGGPQFAVDGVPVRAIASPGTSLPRAIPSPEEWELELVARDVPAFGYRLLRLSRAPQAGGEEADGGWEIAAEGVGVVAEDGGTLAVRFGEREYRGLCALEDVGDRGDTYDFDPVGEPCAPVVSWSVHRSRHASGIQVLEVDRTLKLPARLSDDRRSRSAERVAVRVVVEATVAPGVRRVGLRVQVRSPAEDHRLRLLFPTPAPCERFWAATTFGVAERSTAPRDASRWRHPAPSTFPHQGWVSAGGLMVVAPGLYEAEVTPGGVIAITLLRAVGWLSRPDLTTRPGPAGPPLPTPQAQTRSVDARLWLAPGPDPREARDAELGLWAVVAGEAPLLPPGLALLSIEPRCLVLSALKPAEEGEGMVVRVCNPTNDLVRAELRLGFPVREAAAVRLDEGPDDFPVEVEAGAVRFQAPPRALRSVLLR